ncbi:MAG: hypothetical protein RL087_8, partial [Pseudomonadota bacterium]
MKIFGAGLATETNTFAAAPTGWRSFEEYGVYRGDSSTRAPEGGGALLRCLRDAAEAEGHTVCESVAQAAQQRAAPLGRARARVATVDTVLLEAPPAGGRSGEG